MPIWVVGETDAERADRLVAMRLDEIRRYGREETGLAVPPTVSAEAAWYLLAALDRYARAVDDVRRIVRARIADDLRPGGVARFGGELVRYSRPADPVALPALEDWLRTLPGDDVLRVLPKPTKFRKGGLAAVAERHGLDPETLEGVFWIDRGPEKEPTVTAMPVDHPRAPKYAAEMTDGEIRRKR